MDGDENSRAALDIWFDRQRRQWWRGAWKVGLVSVIVLVGLSKLGQLAYLAYLSQRYSHYPSGYLAQFPANWGLPLVFMVFLIPLAAVILVALLGRHYRIPDELLTASTALDCQRAFQRVFRWDAYLVYGLVLFAPVLIIGVVALPDWQQYLLGLLCTASLTALLVELIVWLHSWQRRLHLAAYLALPFGYLLVQYGLLPMVLALFETLTGQGQDLYMLATLQDAFLVMHGTVCILLTFLVVRQSRRLPAGRDPWRQ